MPSEEWRKVLYRAILSTVGFFLFLIVALFLPGGIKWTQGWIFLAVFLLQVIVAIVYLWHRNPDIFVARSRMPKGTKGWDKVAMLLLLLSLAAVFPVAGLDSRYHWSSVSLGLVVLGYALFSFGMLVSVWAEAVNKFAEFGVRIQTERGHKVVDSGPYAIVRHPIYTSCFFLFPGIATALGSFWALIPAALVFVVLIVRTALEDRTLQNELEGYKQYAKRVRYRLIPGVW